MVPFCSGIVVPFYSGIDRFLYLGNADVPAPDEIGAEFEENDDYRAAEALWKQARVVFVSSSQAEFTESWQSADFTVIGEGENWWLEIESTLRGQQL